MVLLGCSVFRILITVFISVFAAGSLLFCQNTLEIRTSAEHYHIKVNLHRNSLFKVNLIKDNQRSPLGEQKFLTSGEHGFKISKSSVQSDKIVFTVTAFEAEYIKSFGAFGSGMGNFFNPAGITKDRLDRLYVADSNNDRIQVLNKNGGYVTEFGVFDWAEKDIFNNQDGEKFDSDSEFINSGPHLNSPVSIAVGQFVYVVDQGNNRIVKFNNDYSFIKYIGKYGNDRLEFVDVSNITLDDNENIYIVDTGNDRIIKTDSNGNFILDIGSFGRGIENFNRPSSVAVDLARNIYVADAGNRKVKVFDGQGIFQYEFSCATLKGLNCLYSWNENLLIVDSYSKVLYLTDSRGRRFMKITHPKLGHPVSCVVLEDKYVYVTDTEANDIKIFEIKTIEEDFTRLTSQIEDEEK